jgi:hypothetical protein
MPSGRAAWRKERAAMPLVYVTGISGAGKSAIRGELIGMGYAAFGTDEDGYGIWLDKTTGEPAEEPDEPYDRHEWFSRNDEGEQ